MSMRGGAKRRHECGDGRPGSKVDKEFAEWDRKDAPGCSVAAARNGVIFYERGYGMANLELGADHARIAVYGGVDLETDDGDEHSASGRSRQVVDR